MIVSPTIKEVPWRFFHYSLLFFVLVVCVMWMVYKRSANMQKTEIIEMINKSGQSNSAANYCGECGVVLIGNERFFGKCGAEVTGFELTIYQLIQRESDINAF